MLNEPACTFCGKRQRQVFKMIAGPSVYICNECVELCTEIVEEEHERQEGLAHEKEEAAELNSLEMSDGSKQRIDEAPLPMGVREPSVVDLVANLRAACEDPQRLLGAGSHVMLPVELVLAIAEGIETMNRATFFTTRSPGGGASEEVLLIEQAARDIIKLFVTKLFEPVKAEGEKALDACKRLGLSEQQVGAVVAPNPLPSWAPWALGAMVGGVLPLLWGVLKGRAFGKGPA